MPISLILAFGYPAFKNLSLLITILMRSYNMIGLDS